MSVAGDDDDDDAQGPPRKRSRKSKSHGGGRIPAGEDFWGKVDEYFRNEIKERGKNLTGPKWKQYVFNSYIRLEHQADSLRKVH